MPKCKNDCGKDCSKRGKEFCSRSCSRKYAWKTGSYGKDYRENMSKIRKDYLKTHEHPKGMLGKKHSEKTKKLFSKNRKGSLHSRWIGGHPNYWRGKAREIKKDILCCELCGKNSKKLDVHHKDRNFKNNSKENLIKLCCPCHRKQHPEVIELMLKAGRLLRDEGI